MVSFYSSCKIWPPARYALTDNWFVHLGETFVGTVDQILHYQLHFYFLDYQLPCLRQNCTQHMCNFFPPFNSDLLV